MSEDKFVFTVDEYVNRIDKRSASYVARKIAEYDRRWNGKIKLYAGVFDEETEAIQFILNRAASHVSVAESKLVAAKLKLRGLQRKFERAGKGDGKP